LSHFSSSASTTFLHVHIRFHFIYLSHLGVFSRLSSLLNLFNLPFSDFLGSCLPIIIDIGFRYGVVPLAQTPYWFGFVPQHSSFCFCSLRLFPALSSSTVVLCGPCLVPVFTVILIVVLLPFLRPLHALFVPLLPFPLNVFSFLFHNTSHFHAF